MIFVFISDTHDVDGLYDVKIPDGDFLFHAGDITGRGTISELEKSLLYFQSLPHKHKIFVAGNHDFCFEDHPSVCRDIMKSCGFVYLENGYIELDGVKIFASPHQPWFHDWAFNVKSESKRDIIYSAIPNDIDVLLTHTPPYGIMDMTRRKEAVGCQVLLNHIDRIKPKFHCFGHIHEGYGIHETKDTIFVNASICNYKYQPVNKPITFVV